MSFHGLSVCPALGEKADRQRIGTKEELIDKYTIRESIMRKDLWSKRDTSGFCEKKRETDQEYGQGSLDYNSPALSRAGKRSPEVEETVISRELSLTSDYGKDLLSYRLFYIPPSSGRIDHERGMMAAEEPVRPDQRQGIPGPAIPGPACESACGDRKEWGYGIEICHLRKCAGGFWEMKDFERVEAVSRDLKQCSLFFGSLVEGKVFPCSLKELLEDYGELF